MRGKLLKRRTNMLKLHAEAYPLVDIVNQLSSEYDVSKQAIYKDWRNRRTWQTQLLELGDLEQLCLDLYATHKQIYGMAMQAYRTAVQDTAKIGAIRLLRDINLDFSMMFPKVISKQLKNKSGRDINSLLKQYDELFNPDSSQRNITLAWDLGVNKPEIQPIDVRLFNEEEREIMRASCRLIASKRELVKGCSEEELEAIREANRVEARA